MIDIDKLTNHYNGRKEMIRETFRYFMEDAPQALERLGTAIDADQADQAAKAAHTLANLCGVVRSPAAVDHARKLQELLSDTEDRAATRRLYRELARDIEKIQRLISDWDDTA